MQKIDEVKKKIREALARTPPETHEAVENIRKLLSKLYNFVLKHPELVEKTVPLLINIQECIMEGRHEEVLWQLIVLLVLIDLRFSTKNKQ